MKIGIQGGKGSFNHEAWSVYATEHDVQKYELHYLYTTEAVLQAVVNGTIQRGQFAIFNSLGGLVAETKQVIGHYLFTIVDSVSIQISHHLMKRKNISESNITDIMAHPEVFKQCSKKLASQFPYLTLISGEDELIDTAKAAEELYKGDLPDTTAILGPKTLASLYNFDIMAGNLHNNEENYTTFVHVQKYIN